MTVDTTRDAGSSFESDPLLVMLASDDMITNPFAAYAEFLQRPGWHSPSGYRVFSRYRHVDEILRKPAVFGQLTRVQPSFHVMDPPEHTRLRRLVSHAFTPNKIARRRTMIEAVANELIDAVAADGVTDLIPAFANPVPARVTANILGVPYEAGDRWGPWLDTVKESRGVVRYLEGDHEAIEATAAKARAAAREVADHLAAVMVARRNDRGDDIVSALLDAREGNDALTEDEVLFTLILLLGAGLHTTASQLGNTVRALLEHPTELAKLRANPELVDNAVEEALRFDGALQAEHRVVREPYTLDGTPLEPGEHLMIVNGAANRDPDVFPDPDRFDISRENAKNHLAFGFGIHRCLGAELARLELRVAIAVLIERLPDLTLAGPPVQHRFDRFRGLDHLPVAWTPVAVGDAE